MISLAEPVGSGARVLSKLTVDPEPFSEVWAGCLNFLVSASTDSEEQRDDHKCDPQGFPSIMGNPMERHVSCRVDG